MATRLSRYPADVSAQFDELCGDDRQQHEKEEENNGGSGGENPLIPVTLAMPRASSRSAMGSRR